MPLRIALIVGFRSAKARLFAERKATLATPLRIAWIAALLAACIVIGDSALLAVPRVEIELATDGNFPATAQQQWYKLLTELKVDDLRIRKAAPDDKAEITVSGTEKIPVYRVRGRLTGNNELIVPGGRFSSRDREGLSRWLTKLRQEGPERAATKEKLPFGLLPKEFAEVHADLAHKVAFSTKGLKLHEAAAKIAGALQIPLAIDKSAAAGLTRAEPIQEELEGVSSGAALAYLLRPAGLVLEPKLDARRKLQYAITRPSADRTPWPIGWPADRPAREILPQLFEQLNVEIDDTPLSETLEAIAERLGSPVLYDHYALARRGIDPEKAKIKLAPAKLAYAIILNKALHQADLKGEWRIDEAGKPLLWVTTLKPVK
ncbi:MAG TPA: hypothetical protein VN699_08805 [Pirellulales bacterium]|nr:hypothetical protein [Pirellulales bacterium]